MKEHKWWIIGLIAVAIVAGVVIFGALRGEEVVEEETTVPTTTIEYIEVDPVYIEVPIFDRTREERLEREAREAREIADRAEDRAREARQESDRIRIELEGVQDALEETSDYRIDEARLRVRDIGEDNSRTRIPRISR